MGKFNERKARMKALRNLQAEFTRRLKGLVVFRQVCSPEETRKEQFALVKMRHNINTEREALGLPHFIVK